MVKRVLWPVGSYIARPRVAQAPDLGELAQRLANDVHQTLNGANPGDMPFEQPTRFPLLVNLKAAKALDLIVPQLLIASANELIG
jgi:putative ABC transport system substrate-binding protein